MWICPLAGFVVKRVRTEGKKTAVGSKEIPKITFKIKICSAIY